MANHLLSKLSFQQIVIAGIRNVRLSNILQQIQKNKAKKSSESDKDDTPNAKTKDTSHILLVMADGAFRNYLRKALSRYFQISVLKDPDLLKDTVVRQNPDAIIIDDNVNGTNGDALSFRIKTDKMIGYIPVCPFDKGL